MEDYRKRHTPRRRINYLEAEKRNKIKEEIASDFEEHMYSTDNADAEKALDEWETIRWPDLSDQGWEEKITEDGDEMVVQFIKPPAHIKNFEFSDLLLEGGIKYKPYKTNQVLDKFIEKHKKDDMEWMPALAHLREKVWEYTQKLPTNVRRQETLEEIVREDTKKKEETKTKNDERKDLEEQMDELNPYARAAKKKAENIAKNNILREKAYNGDIRAALKLAQNLKNKGDMKGATEFYRIARDVQKVNDEKRTGERWVSMGPPRNRTWETTDGLPTLESTLREELRYETSQQLRERADMHEQGILPSSDETVAILRKMAKENEIRKGGRKKNTRKHKKYKSRTKNPQRKRKKHKSRTKNRKNPHNTRKKYKSRTITRRKRKRRGKR